MNATEFAFCGRSYQCFVGDVRMDPHLARTRVLDAGDRAVVSGIGAGQMANRSSFKQRERRQHAHVSSQPFANGLLGFSLPIFLKEVELAQTRNKRERHTARK